MRKNGLNRRHWFIGFIQIGFYYGGNGDIKYILKISKIQYPQLSSISVNRLKFAWRTPIMFVMTNGLAAFLGAVMLKMQRVSVPLSYRPIEI